jgi:hypothetical protein
MSPRGSLSFSAGNLLLTQLLGYQIVRINYEFHNRNNRQSVMPDLIGHPENHGFRLNGTPE